MAQENANEIAKSYNGKSVASNGETNTLSGWGKYKEPDNLIDRSVTPKDVSLCSCRSIHCTNI